MRRRVQLFPRFHRFLVLCLLPWTLAWPFQGFAEEIHPTYYRHVLGGHVFLPSFIVTPPFADTRVTLSTLGGSGTYSIEALGTTFSNLELGALQPAVQAQFQIVPGLALGLGLAGRLVTGLNTEAVIDYGATVAYTLQANALFEFLRGDSDSLSIGLEYGRPHKLAVGELELSGVLSVLGGGGFDLSAESVTSRWYPDLRYAHSFAPSFGLQAYAGFRIDHLEYEGGLTDTRSRLILGLGLSYDLNSLIGVPMGVTASYRRGQVISEGDANVNTYSFGLYESILANFNVGVEIGWAQQGSLDSTLFGILMRKYYN